MIVLWAAMVAAMGVKALLGFVLGVIVVIATSLAVGLACASVHHRRGSEDDWLGP
jgi:hypothetical protein